jgi:hypothetical protein
MEVIDHDAEGNHISTVLPFKDKQNAADEKKENHRVQKEEFSDVEFEKEVIRTLLLIIL